MKHLLLTILLIHACSEEKFSINQHQASTKKYTNVMGLVDAYPLPESVPYGFYPMTPSQGILMQESKVHIDSLHLNNGRAFLKDTSFSGWTYQIFENNEHRYRYTKFENGFKVWQIGYYENGVLDHDFHVLNNENKGSQRMWRSDGSPYIDNYFLEGGILHGVQKRWYADYQLAMESKYDEGKLIYKYEYDKKGNLLRRKEP